MRKLVIISCIVISAFYHAQELNAQNLQHELISAKNDTLKILVLSSLIDEFTETQPDTAFEYAKQMLHISEKLRLKLIQADALSNMGYAQINLGNYPGSLESLLAAIKIGEDPAVENPALDEKYFHDNDFLRKPVTMKMRRLAILAQTHQYLGILYSNTNNSEKELAQYRKALVYAKESGNVIALVTTYLTLGRSYLVFKNTDSALYAEHKAYELAKSSGFTKYNGSILLTMGRIETERGNDQQALDFFKQSITESAQHNYLRGVISSNLYIADIFKKMGQDDSVIFYQRSALQVAEKLNSSSLLLRCYAALAGYYQVNLNKDSLVKYQGLVIKLNDSLFNAKQYQQFENIDADAEQRRLEMVNAKKAYEQRLQNNLLLGGLIAFLVVAVILYRNNQQRKKVNDRLQQQKIELEKALGELRNTQAQLIQSEKMASLGELTAGIAHEIQNPLNFVNNFSEINHELLEELKQETAKGNIDQINSITNDLVENEKKINHHGKRADAIVKSMLQHSRSSSGQKELIDINTLAEEYLRLAYHGFRSRDNSFHAEIETRFDKSINKIKAVPQEIGRVLLNLLNNAFHTVAEKRNRMKQTGYEPEVFISTSSENGKVFIRISDNGMGIPSKITDKVFQPFFTTKPSGEGTGLGLSLAYDIVKAHGGNIHLTSEEGQGTSFTIELPMS